MDNTIEQELAGFADNLYAVSPLALADRCDQCPNGCSQAFVRAYKLEPFRELLLCGHHANEHEPRLVAEGWLLQDERGKINTRPMSGAPESGLTANED